MARSRYPSERESWHTLTANWRGLEEQTKTAVDPQYATDRALMPWPGVLRENLGQWPDDSAAQREP